MSQTSDTTGRNKISTFVLAAIYITLILSIVAIAVAVFAFYSGESIEITIYLLIIGFLSMSLSGYILLQSRKRMASLKIETPQILTTVECKKCGTKKVREFQRGDYVFKEAGPCEKCPDDKQIITAIYKEVKEKEKAVKV
ncbi:MAG: hypothetical protein ACE14S_01710 [Candidatus Bathyarchaeia archaeon]